MRQTVERADGGDPAPIRRALRRLWLVITFFVLGLGLGAQWDRAWHVTHPFEDFFSPPHLFIYANLGLAALLALWLARDPGLGPVFGSPLYVRLGALSASVPKGLALLLGGFGVLGLAGLTDMIWHTRFGLDETNWSFPHAMIGWGSLLVVGGFASARLTAPAPARWWTRLVFWVVIAGLAANVVSGPLGQNATLEQVRRVAALPPLAADPAPQHTLRIYERWNITRSNPWFVPVSALGVGLGLALVRRLERRTTIFLLAALLSTWFSMGGAQRAARFLGIGEDPRAWAPLPLVFAALVFVTLRSARMPSAWAWAGAGLLHGVWIAAIWGQAWAVALVAAACMPAGAKLGEWTADLIRKPDRRVLGIVAGAGLAIPATLGMIDLALRAATP